MIVDPVFGLISLFCLSYGVFGLAREHRAGQRPVPRIPRQRRPSSSRIESKR